MQFNAIPIKIPGGIFADLEITLKWYIKAMELDSL